MKRTSENTPCGENFYLLIEQLAMHLQKHKGKKLYGYLNKETKNIVDDIVKVLAQDERIAELYKEWNNINRQKLSVYHDKPNPDIPLENNKEFKSIKNAIIKAVAELDKTDQTQTANPRVTEMVTLWTKLLGSLINNSYQQK